MLSQLMNRLEDLYSEMVELRRDFHMYPELSFQEERTPAKIAQFLSKCDLEVREGVGGRGVVGILVGGEPGKTVGLRADFDGLPIQDEKDVPYKSRIPGVMHACGHDAHTAALLCIAKALSEVKYEIKGNIVFIFQFAEEVGPGGARPMIEDGCLNGVDAIFGTHFWSGFPVGTIAYRSGFIMAAADSFELEVIGKGGHGATPHQTIDPVIITAQILMGLQTIVSRRVDPLKSAVITVGSIHGGSAASIIPEIISLTGTVRTFEENVQTQIISEIEKVVQGACIQAGATYSYTFSKGYPAVRNHASETKVLLEAVKRIGNVDLLETEPLMAAEDFSYYLNTVPGVFFFTGVGNAEIGASYPHHHPKFDIDERGMLMGAKALICSALTYLEMNN